MPNEIETLLRIDISSPPNISSIPLLQEKQTLFYKVVAPVKKGDTHLSESPFYRIWFYDKYL